MRGPKDRVRVGHDLCTRTCTWGTTDSSDGALGLYATVFSKNSGYLDLVGQFQGVRNDYEDQFGIRADHSGTGFGLGAEAGQPWQVGNNGLWLEPQAQLVYQNMAYNGFADSVGRISGYTAQSLRGRGGLRLAWTGTPNPGEQTGPLVSLTTSLVRELLDPEPIAMDGVTVAPIMDKQTWVEMDLWGQLPVSDNGSLFAGLQLQRDVNGTERNGVLVRAGLTFTW